MKRILLTFVAVVLVGNIAGCSQNALSEQNVDNETTEQNLVKGIETEFKEEKFVDLSFSVPKEWLVEDAGENIIRITNEDGLFVTIQYTDAANSVFYEDLDVLAQLYAGTGFGIEEFEVLQSGM